MATRTSKSTMVELVEELEKLRPLFIQEAGRGADEVLDFLIHEAKAGEFHDYKNQKYVCGKVAAVGLLRQLYEQCVNRGFVKLADELARIGSDVTRGEYDEEADEDDQRELAKHLAEIPAFRPKL